MRRFSFLAALFLLAGTVAHAAPMVRNGSFEADGGFIASPGTAPTLNTLQSWVYNNPGGAAYGRNVQNQNLFYDNGVAPHGVNCGYLQNAGILSQDIEGFEAGKTYEVSLAVNARSSNATSATLTLRLGGDTLIPTTPIGNVDPQGVFSTPWPVYTENWTAPADGTYTLEI